MDRHRFEARVAVGDLAGKEPTAAAVRALGREALDHVLDVASPASTRSSRSTR